MINNDAYREGDKQQYKSEMKGRDHFKFTNNSSQSDRIQNNYNFNSSLDPSPAETGWAAWNLRPRELHKEVGPKLKFNYRNQLERIVDSLNSQTGHHFDNDEIVDKGVHSKLRS